MGIDPQALYLQIGRLLETTPDLSAYPRPEETRRWLGRVYALVAETADKNVIQALDLQISRLDSNVAAIHEDAKEKVQIILHRALAIAELKAPAAVQGAFIPAGNAFDALAALGKVLATAKQDLLIVDPYMDEKVLTEFAALADEKVRLRLLADQQSVKGTLRPAAERWSQQYGVIRPLEVRLSAPRALHDRLIIVDRANAWILTQSFNAFASRSPASINRSEAEVASLKMPYYEDVWAKATSL